MAELTDPLSALTRLREVEDQLYRLRQVVASVAGGLSHFAQYPGQLDRLDVPAVVAILQTSYRRDLSARETEDLCRGSLWRARRQSRRVSRC